MAKKDRVELFIPKGYASEEANEIICVNGLMFVLPKGKTSMVPPFVAEEYRRSQRAKSRLDETVEKMLGAGA